MPSNVQSDLVAVRRWMIDNTLCRRQERDGWYVKDCLEVKARSRCGRCQQIARLNRSILPPIV